jgi:hypothetical protein
MRIAASRCSLKRKKVATVVATFRLASEAYFSISSLAVILSLLFFSGP